MSVNRNAHSLACIIVTYNREDELRECLINTLRQKVDLVIVIDNASSDGTEEILLEFKKKDSRLIVERQKRSRGGSWGYARGMRLADRLLKGDGWLLLYDDDSWPEAECIARFRQNVETYEQKGIAAVGGAVFDANGQPVEANRPILNLFRRPLKVLSLTVRSCGSIRDLYHVPHRLLRTPGTRLRVDAISFVGLFLNLNTLPHGRGRYPRGCLFLYSDDTTYTLDLERRGKRLILDSSLNFCHNTKGGGAAAGRLTPEWKNYYIVRNSFLMNRALSRLWYLPLCIATVLTHTARGLLLWWHERDGTLLKLVGLGTWDGMRNDYARSHEKLKTLCKRIEKSTLLNTSPKI